MTPQTRSTSNALRTMRFGATLSCWVFGVSLAIQTLTWAFVNFTEIRYARIEDTSRSGKPAVMIAPETDYSGDKADSDGARRDDPLDSSSADHDEQDHSAGRPNVRPTSAAAADPTTITIKTADINRGLTSYDIYLRHTHELARVLGLMAIFVLFVQLTLSVVVASQTHAPGLAHVVAGHGWCLILIMLTIPWQSFVPDFPLTGLFSEYGAMARASELYLASHRDADPAFVFYGSYLVLPMACAVGVALIGLKFRRGVEGQIISGPSQFEIQLEQEAANREPGSLVGAGRNAAALRTTMAPEPPPAGPVVPHHAAPAEIPSITRPATTPPLRRPI